MRIHWMAVAATVLLLCVLCCTVHAADESESQLQQRIKQDVSFLKSNVFSFWQRYGLDKEHGGFHGTLDRSGAAISPTDKGLIQQARHIWAFSTFHQAGYSPGSPSAQDMAQSAYEFVVRHMRDPADGLWFNSVTREGQVADSGKMLYGQWFVLYAFSQYAQVFGVSAAKDLALATFKATDAAWHNSDTGGYIEGGKRTLNGVMHGIEALTALHRATGDGTVLSRLLGLLGIICTRLGHTNGLVHEEYQAASDNAPWTPASGTTLYGHNMEVAWLVADTLDYLQSISAIDSSLASKYRAAAMALGASAARGGYDAQHGGVFESPSSQAKIWWAQAESMLGFWKLHEYYKGAAADASSVISEGGKAGCAAQQNYLRMLAGTAKFVRQYQTDTAVAGEQFWQVNADGSWGLTGKFDKDTKGNRWKASYHSSRAPLFLEKWM